MSEEVVYYSNQTIKYLETILQSVSELSAGAMEAYTLQLIADVGGEIPAVAVGGGASQKLKINLKGVDMPEKAVNRLLWVLNAFQTLSKDDGDRRPTLNDGLNFQIRKHEAYLRAAEAEHDRKQSGGTCSSTECRHRGSPHASHYHVFQAKFWIGDQVDFLFWSMDIGKPIVVVDCEGDNITLKTKGAEDGVVRPTATIYMPHPSVVQLQDDLDQLTYNGSIHITGGGLRFKGWHKRGGHKHRGKGKQKLGATSIAIDLHLTFESCHLMIHSGQHYQKIAPRHRVPKTSGQNRAGKAAFARVTTIKENRKRKNSNASVFGISQKPKLETKKKRVARKQKPKEKKKDGKKGKKDSHISASPLMQSFAMQRKKASTNTPQYAPNPILKWDYDVGEFNVEELFGAASQKSRKVMSMNDVKRGAVELWNSNGVFLIQAADKWFYEAHLKKEKGALTDQFVWKADSTNRSEEGDPPPEIGMANLYGGIHMEVKERFGKYALPKNPHGAPVLVKDGCRWGLAHHAKTDGGEMETVLVFKELGESGESFESTYQRILTDAITASSTSSDSTNRSRQLPTSSQNLAASGTSVSSETDMFKAAFQVSDSD